MAHSRSYRLSGNSVILIVGRLVMYCGQGTSVLIPIFGPFVVFNPFLLFDPSLSLRSKFSRADYADHFDFFWGQLFLSGAWLAIVHVAAVFKLPPGIMATRIIDAPELTHNRCVGRRAQMMGLAYGRLFS